MPARDNIDWDQALRHLLTAAPEILLTLGRQAGSDWRVEALIDGWSLTIRLAVPHTDGRRRVIPTQSGAICAPTVEEQRAAGEMMARLPVPESMQIDTRGVEDGWICYRVRVRRERLVRKT